ncbi:TetR/AcrR family transcriptional regulator [Candidatus Poriferisocius sp.]|uniref:TetR/AcrR family transcriptional regulator n=1 Tax=Candidatus Poriferisocius sp. TaxID=3101276 RepID=UPI003B598953
MAASGGIQQDKAGQRSAKRRKRRDRGDIRSLLIETACIEFGQHGFEGASTRAIAARVDAHQPQINYHFSCKEDLWRASVNHLFSLLDSAMAGVEDIEDLGERFAETIRRQVRFAAEHPELNRIIVQEASSPSARMEWVTETHVRPRFEERRKNWQQLRRDNIAAPVDELVVHHVLIGAATLPYVNAPEAELLIGSSPTDPAHIEAHAESLVACFLPGLSSTET